jgi:beta-galactosidase
MSVKPLVLKGSSYLLLVFLVSFIHFTTTAQTRSVADFDKGWHFHLGDVNGAESPVMNDDAWRTLDLPHDWSIEGKFSKDNPATPGTEKRLPFQLPQKTKRFISILTGFTRKALFG